MQARVAVGVGGLHEVRPVAEHQGLDEPGLARAHGEVERGTTVVARLPRAEEGAVRLKEEVVYDTRLSIYTKKLQTSLQKEWL